MGLLCHFFKALVPLNLADIVTSCKSLGEVIVPFSALNHSFLFSGGRGFNNPLTVATFRDLFAVSTVLI